MDQFFYYFTKDGQNWYRSMVWTQHFNLSETTLSQKEAVNSSDKFFKMFSDEIFTSFSEIQ